MQNDDHGMVSGPMERTHTSRFRAWRVIAVFTVLTTLLFLAGCASDIPVPSNNHTAQKVLVDYTRSGGIAAFNDRVVIFENGQAVYSRNSRTGEFTLPADQLSELQKLLVNADFPSLAPSYPAPSPGADYFQYTITYGDKTVTTETGGVPDALLAIIGRLDALLAENAPLS
ncbi:MAG: hypothetical protein LUQ33_04725 [Methanoregulaceae archaeon]|nr:hypothetical protein [Methanoregulaceae archaeon]